MLTLRASALQMRMDKSLDPFAFVTRRIEYKHLRCAKNKTYYEFKLSFFLLFLCL